MSLPPMGAILNTMENLRSANKPKVSDQLLEMARKEPDAVLKELESQANGLSMAEAEERVKREGLNEIAREKHQLPLMRLWDNIRNPLVILLIGLGVLSYLTGDLRAMIVIFVMVVARHRLALLSRDARRQDEMRGKIHKLIMH